MRGYRRGQRGHNRGTYHHSLNCFDFDNNPVEDGSSAMAPATSNDNHAPLAAAAIGRGSSGRGRGRSRASSRGVAVTIMPATVSDNQTPYFGVFEFATETREPRERPVTVPE